MRFGQTLFLALPYIPTYKQQKHVIFVVKIDRVQSYIYVSFKATLCSEEAK